MSDLGFKSGNEFKPYSEQEYHKIDQLTVRVKNIFSGKINEKYNEDGFEVEEGTCQIDIINNNSEILKSYIIKTKNNNNLKILDKPEDLGTNIIFYEKNRKSIKKGTKASDFKLKFKVDKQGQWDALISFLNTKVYTFFYDSPKDGNKVSEFNNSSDQLYLQIDFGKINILNYRIGPISIID